MTTPTTSVRSPGSASTVWQIKVSTACDLRCRYCYEWERLGDSRRLTLEQWRRILEAAQCYRRIRQDRHGVRSHVVIVWHGGEPLLLHAGYVADVLQLQGAIFSAEAAPTNVLQTNLHRVNDTLRVMQSAGFTLSVSVDLAPGARVDARERETEVRTLENLERVVSAGGRCGVALVVGRHNHRRLPEIYDRLDRLGVEWLRLIPLFEPPESAPVGDLQLNADEIVAAFTRLFAHWTQRGARLPVYPFDRILTAVRHRSGRPAVVRDRRTQGETRLVVHPDGTLTDQAGTIRPDSVFGNVFTDPAEDLFDSPGYHASLDRDDALRSRHCGACAHRALCDTRALSEYPHRFPPGPCPVESPLLTLAADYVRQCQAW